MTNTLTTIAGFPNIAKAFLTTDGQKALGRYAEREAKGQIKTDLLFASNDCIEGEVFTKDKKGNAQPSYRVTITPLTIDCTCNAHDFYGRKAGNWTYTCTHAAATFVEASKLVPMDVAA